VLFSATLRSGLFAQDDLHYFAVCSSALHIPDGVTELSKEMKVAPDGIARASNGAAIKVTVTTKSAPAVRQIMRETVEDVDAMIDGANDTANLLATTNDSTTLVAGNDDGRRRMSEGQLRLAKHRELHKHRRLNIRETLPPWVAIKDFGEGEQIDAGSTMVPRTALKDSMCYYGRATCASIMGSASKALSKIYAAVTVSGSGNRDKGLGQAWIPDDHFGLCWFTATPHASSSFYVNCWTESEWAYWRTVSGGIGRLTAVTLLQNEYMSQLGLSYAAGRRGVKRFYDTAFRVRPVCIEGEALCMRPCLMPVWSRALASLICSYIFHGDSSRSLL
jgi:hypothetical protein